MLKKKTPSLSDRLTAADAAQSSALAGFEAAAAALDDARDVHVAIADEATAEAIRLSALAVQAQEKAAQSARAAENVRGLFA